MILALKDRLVYYVIFVFEVFFPVAVFWWYSKEYLLSIDNI